MQKNIVFTEKKVCLAFIVPLARKDDKISLQYVISLLAVIIEL